MALVRLGRASFLDAPPPGADIPSLLDGRPAVPKVTEALTGPVPTNDWWSSLAYPFTGNPFSEPMYADPLTLKAEAGGLAIGHTLAPRFLDGAPGDPGWQGVKYEYGFQPQLRVGLAGLAATEARADGFGDWTVTARWRDADQTLRATFGHGLPFVFLERQGPGDALLTVVADAGSRVNVPTSPLTWTITGLTGTLDPAASLRFRLPVDAGSSVANGPQLRVTYDFEGDGTPDRVETWKLFPTDAAAGWEGYTEAQGLAAATGALRDLAGGSVTLELWNAIGSGVVSVKTDAPAGADPAWLRLPYLTLADDAGATLRDLYLRGTPEAGGAATALSGTPGSAAAAADWGALGNAWGGQGDIWYNGPGMLGVTVRGVHYGVFAPDGAGWTITADGLRSALGGADHFAVAVLPDASLATLHLFAAHSEAVPTETRFSFGFDQTRGTVTARFTTETADGTAPLTALYRHQWMATEGLDWLGSYASPRGEMQLAESDGFTTTYAASPMLPVLPLLDAGDRAAVRTLVEAEAARLLARPVAVPQTDTYWAGKELGRLSELAQVANQVGATAARDTFLGVIRRELEDWFRADDGTPKLFAQNSQWGTLQGYPSSYGADSQLNDHHFHYGYFVQAAATLTEFNPAWGRAGNWGGMVNRIIADVAGTLRDGPYPFLRIFDPYAGHSWASGHGAFGAGNNQESASEALNFAAAVALWGVASGQRPLRDLGMALHSIESAAMHQYWFDVDDAVFPEGFRYGAVGMVWGDGGDHRTFFSADPALIRGINMLPITAAGSLHFALHPDKVVANYDEVEALSGGLPGAWQDILWQYLALGDPARARALLDAHPGYAAEAGASAAQTRHWIAALDGLGTLDPELRADSAFHAVFTKDGERSYVAWNPTDFGRIVRFTDGTLLGVGGHSEAVLHDGDVTRFAIGATTLPAARLVTKLVADGEDAFTFQAGKRAPVLQAATGPGDPNPPGANFLLEARHVSGSIAPGERTRFVLDLDAGTQTGNAVWLRVAYDFEGDGTIDRRETWGPFRVDGRLGWQRMTEGGGPDQVSGGAMRDFTDGLVRVVMWTSAGDDEVAWRDTTARLVLPFAGDAASVV